MAPDSSYSEQRYPRESAAFSSPAPATPYIFPSSWTLHESRGFYSKYFHPTFVAHEIPSRPGHVAVWTARRHRKGIPPYIKQLDPQSSHVPSERPRSLLAPFGYRLLGWEPLRLSFWVAQCFIWGSVVWVVNGVYAFWPVSNASTLGDILGYTGLAGGGLFFLGSILGLFELANAEEKVSLPPHQVKHSAVQMEPPAKSDHSKVASESTPAAPPQPCDLEGQPLTGEGTDCKTYANPEPYGVETSPKKRFKFWIFQPRNLSWWLVVSQLIGATIFGFSACVTGVPNVLSTEDEHHYVIWDILFWGPQVVGSLFFILNGFFAMAEAQHMVIGVELNSVAWHVGFWNLLGATGFFLSGVFGFWAFPSEDFQHWGTAFSTLWGSVFFLISSYFLLPEMLNN